jgi:hypothetical protein
MAAAPYRRVAQGDDIPVNTCSRSRSERFFDKVYACEYMHIAVSIVNDPVNEPVTAAQALHHHVLGAWSGLMVL